MNIDLQIMHLSSQKMSLIQERNKILGNIFYFLFPSRRKKLKLIEKQIDELDIKIYLLGKENNKTKPDLNKIIKTAEETLAKYKKYVGTCKNE